MRRIAVINQKGGVGKTTTAVNLGAGLARLGRRVLICDLDPQCNLTVHVNVDPADEQASVYEILHGEATLEQAVRAVRQPGLSVLPSSVDLAGVELELVNVVGREVILRDAFEADERAHGGPRWDHVLVDCPPSLGLLSLNALVLCDEVLVPVQSEFFALQGLSKLTEIVDLVQRRLNPRLRVTGLLSCRHDRSTNLGRQVLDDIRAHFGDVLLRSSIRRNVKLAEAPSHGLTIFEYDPESRGAQDYLDLARELLAQELPAGATLPEVTVAAPRAPAATRVASAPPQRLASGRFATAATAAATPAAPKPAADKRAAPKQAAAGSPVAATPQAPTKPAAQMKPPAQVKPPVQAKPPEQAKPPVQAKHLPQATTSLPPTASAQPAPPSRPTAPKPRQRAEPAAVPATEQVASVPPAPVPAAKPASATTNGHGTNGTRKRAPAGAAAASPPPTAPVPAAAPVASPAPVAPPPAATPAAPSAATPVRRPRTKPARTPPPETSPQNP